MLFDLFKRKKKNPVTETALSEKDLKWNKMWELWANGEIESPYNELMTYHGEINNGGHSQYFSNIECNGDVEGEIAVLCEIVPQILKENICRAYQAHLILEQDETDEDAESVIKECDEIFFANEQLITDILEKFAYHS